MEKFTNLWGVCRKKIGNVWSKPESPPTDEKSVNLLTWTLNAKDEKSYRHWALSVFGKTYEYTPTGISFGARPRRNFEQGVLGSTDMSSDEFESWVFAEDEQFQKSNFEPGVRDSHHFVLAACEQLKIDNLESLSSRVQVELNDFKWASLDQVHQDAFLKKYSQTVTDSKTSNMFNS